MTMEALRTRIDEDCLSDRRLDALSAGELESEAAGAAREHLARCARCAARREALARDAEAFLAAHPAPPAQRVVALSTRRRPRALWWSAGLAAAAALLFMVRSPEPQERSKGEGSVGFFVRHGDTVRRGSSGERVMPGDALRFVVSQREPSHVAVLSRDAAGQASVYFPAGEHAVLVDAGVEHALDSSVILDEVLGTERLYALRCTRAVELAPLRARLAASEVEPAWPQGCQVERLTLLKVWPP
jgi:hypothetical protein